MFRKTYLLTLLIIIFLVNPVFATTGKLVEFLADGISTTSNGVLVGGKVYTYAAGTTTLKPLYTDVSLSTQADDPLILDENGRAVVYGDGMYKFVVQDQYGIDLYTVDNIELQSIVGFVQNSTNPFGSTLTQSTLIASSTTTTDLTANNIMADNVSVNDNFTSVGDAHISSLSATLGGALDANNKVIDNLATPTKDTQAVNKGYLTFNGINNDHIRVFDTVGVSTFTCPLGVHKVVLTLIGAGGGGGGWGDAGNFAGEAGWPGQAVVGYVFNTTPGQSYRVDVGAGGVAGTDGDSGASGGIGGAGEGTYFGTVHVEGGAGGYGAGASADCIAGVKNSMSFPKGNIGYFRKVAGDSMNAFVKGQGGMGGNIATYTSPAVYVYHASPGFDGMVIVQW